MKQSISDREKIVSQYVSDKQPLIVCHDKVVTKKLWNSLWS